MYPECEKMLAVQDKSQAIGEFLEWLRAEGYILGKYDLTLSPASYTIENLLAQYFQIDLSEVEREKRAMLEAMR